MRKYIYTTLMILITTLPAAYADKHTFGTNMSCAYDSTQSRKWVYYFCGKHAKERYCAGHKYRSHNIFDMRRLWSSGDDILNRQEYEVFTFGSAPQDTYCCCDGSNEKTGRFVKALNPTNCHTDDAPTKTIIKEDGQWKEVLSYKTVCGSNEKESRDITPEQSCESNQTWREEVGSCAPICNGGQVYESQTSNNCITCETSAYQGIVIPATGTDNTTNIGQAYCMKCNKDTEFFRNGQCVEKSKMTKYSNSAMKKCWRCPDALFKDCVKEASEASTFSDDIKNKCSVDDN